MSSRGYLEVSVSREGQGGLRGVDRGEDAGGRDQPDVGGLVVAGGGVALVRRPMLLAPGPALCTNQDHGGEIEANREGTHSRNKMRKNM